MAAMIALADPFDSFGHRAVRVAELAGDLGLGQAGQDLRVVLRPGQDVTVADVQERDGPGLVGAVHVGGHVVAADQLAVQRREGLQGAATVVCQLGGPQREVRTAVAGGAERQGGGAGEHVGDRGAGEAKMAPGAEVGQGDGQRPAFGRAEWAGLLADKHDGRLAADAQDRPGRPDRLQRGDRPAAAHPRQYRLRNRGDLADNALRCGRLAGGRGSTGGQLDRREAHHDSQHRPDRRDRYQPPPPRLRTLPRGPLGRDPPPGPRRARRTARPGVTVPSACHSNPSVGPPIVRVLWCGLHLLTRIGPSPCSGTRKIAPVNASVPPGRSAATAWNWAGSRPATCCQSAAEPGCPCSNTSS